MDLNELLHRQEPLHDDLLPYVEEIDRLGTAVRHPLIFSVPHSDQLNALVNYQYQQKRSLVEKARQEGEWGTFIFLHERPYRFGTLETIRHCMPAVQFWKLFGDCWTDSENIWQNREIINRMLRRKASPQHRSAMMDFEELEALGGLPDLITVHRGCQRRNADGLSWTLNRERAIWFARRFCSNDAQVVTGVVKKVNVIAYFLGRNEDEIICFPDHVKNKATENLQ